MTNAIHDHREVYMHVEEAALAEDSGFSKNYYFFKLNQTFIHRDLDSSIVPPSQDAIFEDAKEFFILPISIGIERSDLNASIKISIDTSFFTFSGKPTKLWSHRLLRALIEENAIKIWGKRKLLSDFYKEGEYSSHILSLTCDYCF